VPALARRALAEFTGTVGAVRPGRADRRQVRPIRDEIAARVSALLAELDVPAVAG
jgi:hypothetical protein